MLEVPAPTPVALPAVVIVATAGVAEAQVTVLVRSWVELSVKVPRHRGVVIEYLNASGQTKKLELVGFPARVVQHETDHLDGILTIDRAESMRDIVKTSVLEEMMERDKELSADVDPV